MENRSPDQEFTKGNRGLQLSCQYNLPVRVIRGYQIKNGPQNGYRYDGLYYVTNYERARGQRGFFICRFHLVSEWTIDELERSLSPSLKSNYQRATRAAATVNRIKRKIKISEDVKSMYAHRCQICDVRLNSPSGPIAIGAHIKGLGQPHNGPDAIENMLCLCPNHHDQFDCFSYYIDSKTFEVRGLEGFQGKTLNFHPKHKIDPMFFEYQKNQYLKNNDQSK